MGRGAGFGDVAAEEFTHSMLIPGNDAVHSCRRWLEGTPFLGMLLDAGGEDLAQRASQMMADIALANGGEEVLLEEADPEWKGIDIADGLHAPHRALRFVNN